MPTFENKFFDQEEKNLTDEEKWERLEKTGILKNWGGDKVIIDNNAGVIKLISKVDEKEEAIALSNYKKFAGKKLVFKNCFNLKIIEANCLNLTGLEVENCPNLEHLSAYNNQLEDLNLTGLENLKLLRVNDNKLNSINLNSCKKLGSLDVRNNKLSILELDDISELTYLNCSRNNIKLLSLNSLTKLETLHCYFNNILSLDCKGLVNLKDLNCHNNNDAFSVLGKTHFLRLSALSIGDCKNLEKLDAAENDLTDFEIYNFPKLKVISLKENQLINVSLEKISNLKFLDISRQFKRNWDNSNMLEIHTKFSVKKGDAPDLKNFFYSRGAKFFTFSDYDDESTYKEIKKKTIRKIFPKLKKFECSTGETHDFEKYLDKLRRKKQAKKLKKLRGNKPNDSGYASEDNQNDDEEPIITDPSQIESDYPDLLALYGNEPEITIPGLGLAGKLIIDGYQGYKINVGNNRLLRYLVVKNCPNLTTLRYAHCGLKHDAWYHENNPNLTIIDNHNWDGGIEWGNPEENQKDGKKEFNQKLNKAREFKQKLNQKVKTLLERIEKGEANGFEQFINSFWGQGFEAVFADLTKDTQTQFKKTFVPKLEEKVQNLISNYSKDKSWFLTEVAKLKPFFAYLSDDLKNQLTKSVESIASPTVNYVLFLPLFLFLAFLMIWIALFRFLKKKITEKN